MAVQRRGEGADLLQVAEVALEQDDAAKPPAEQGAEYRPAARPFEAKTEQRQQVSRPVIGSLAPPGTLGDTPPGPPGGCPTRSASRGRGPPGHG